MKYLCMVALDEKKLAEMSQEQRAKLDDDSLAYDETLRKSGHLLAAQALQGVDTATTIRTSSGKLSLTDGPFTETHEQIGGFILIEARDLNEAVQLASRAPVLRLGCIEIRPIQELTSSTARDDRA